MGNKITDQLKIGTMGELLVQLQLLRFNVQAAPPIKDSGTDLIAVRGDAFRSIQVKTTTSNSKFRLRKLPMHYHLVALVRLEANDVEVFFDSSKIYLVLRAVIEKEGVPENLDKYLIKRELIDELFS